MGEKFLMSHDRDLCLVMGCLDTWCDLHLGLWDEVTTFLFFEKLRLNAR